MGDRRSSVWVNGSLYDRNSLPPEIAIRFGTSLGISPVCHLREQLLLVRHIAVLERAAGTLGYVGFDADTVRATIAASDAPATIVALVPSPADHKAAAPGTDWTVVTEPFTAPDASTPLRLIVSRHRRNHRSPTANALLLGDAELRAGTREATAAACDEVVWLQLDDAVSCIGPGVLFAEIAGRVVTPPLADGVPDSAWRGACIDRATVAEARISLDALRSATSVACLWPWGSVQAVAQIDDVTYADHSLAPTLAAAIATTAGPT